LGKKVGEIGNNKLVKKKRFKISDFQNASLKMDVLETDHKLSTISNKEDSIFSFISSL
tara:strand:+ start:338 stop:511 length:174 start_codon:yes stop_codon:yes gene_type:complete